MLKIKERTFLIALMALLAVFAGCKGESPTAPTTTTTPPSGGTPPPTGASIALTSSNSTPLVDSSVKITATVTDNGQPAANGTAVQFTTTIGTFTEANSSSVIRTTTNGIATVTLTSSTAGAATITAVVNNVSASTKVTFNVTPPVIPPPDLTPHVTSISPAIGRPQGGEILTINGDHFSSPKVVFDFGGGKTVEAFPVSSTSTQIQVLTPAVDLGAGQQKTATIIVINNAGTSNEVRVTAATTFTFQSTVLTPKITAVSPASGPIDGGTRVTIFGEGFQAPLQVFFGSAEAPLASGITFNQLTVIAPTASLTNPNGSGAVLGPVNITIINIASNTNVTATNAFRYIQKMQITAFGPGAGSAFGGTDVTIDGAGFNDPVTVSLAGIAANVLKVSGSQILVRASRVPVPCSPPTAPVAVSNVDNGDSAISTASFAYIAEKPVITAISPGSVTAGSAFNATVLKPGVGPDGTGVIRFTVASKTAFPTPTVITDPQGPITFSVVTPTTLTFPSVACTVGSVAGTQFGPLTADVGFINNSTGCTDSSLGSITILPPGPNACVVPVTPGPPTAVVAPATFCPSSPNGFGTVTVGMSNSKVMTIKNTAPSGSAALTFAIVVTGPNAGDFAAVPASGSVAPGLTQAVTVTFTPGAAGPRTAQITITTNDPSNSLIMVNLCGDGV
jgi:hypothetical protein